MIETIRCSSLPLVMLCARSRDPDTLRVDPHNPAASLGSAVHECLARVVMGEDYDPAMIAARHQLTTGDKKKRNSCDRDEMERLTAVGRGLWHRDLKRHFPNPQVEVPVEIPLSGNRSILGHIDVLDYETGIFLDWKTGYEDADHFEQVNGYALGCLGLGLKSVKGIIASLRLGTLDVLTWHEEDIDKEVQRIEERLSDREFHPGGHCEHCPRRDDCPAKKQLVQAALFEIAISEIDLNEALSDPKSAGDLWGRLTLIEGACERLRAAIKEECGRHPAGIPISDTKALKVLTSHREAIVDPLAAWPVLEGLLTQDEIARCITVHKTRVLDAVGEKATTGKGKAKDEALAALRDAGACNTYPRAEMRAVKRSDK